MIRDKAAHLISGSFDYVSFQRILWQCVAHEIGHDATSEALSDDHSEGGLMDFTVLGAFPDTTFAPPSIKRFRDANQWRK